MCVHRKVTGVDFDGGYAEYVIAPSAALAAIPEDLPAEKAGPFMCAGVTVYNALRHSGARGGDVVAVHGIGGLGHLGVQYARRLGFKTVAIGRGRDKEALARQRPGEFVSAPEFARGELPREFVTRHGSQHHQCCNT